MQNKHFLFVILILLSGCGREEAAPGETVEAVMDDVITRLYKAVPPEQYDSIDDAFILGFITPAEKEVLATRYQYFSVNVPAIVSVMRHQEQKTVPFWLEQAGFGRTDLLVKNESYTYEVWQKRVDKGLVSLGINGFDKHRPVYFVSVAPQHPHHELIISNSYPGAFPMDTLQTGAFTYHDWSDLVLTEVPPSMKGQLFFTTVRGRAREAHVINAFRETPFPSSETPDQIMLTWSNSPENSIDIQWRTSPSVADGFVQYWEEGTTDTVYAAAQQKTIQDRMLFNDRYVNRYTASLAGLKPGTRYHYRAGSKQQGLWSQPEAFETEKENRDTFSFIWFGDTHCFPDSGKLVSLAEKEKNTAFYSIAGDLVSTGLYRDDWDKLFAYSKQAFARIPLMPVPGNHDRQDGLGAQLYYDLFSLPENGPERVEKESSYSFEYGNALFMMIDATSEIADHTAWLEKTLSNTKAAWKFVMFHFPPYNFEEPYKDIQAAWVPIFDKYHVDMVMGGHIHYYMRSAPMYNGTVTDSFDKGTVYVISISIPSRHESMDPEPYAVVRFRDGYFYQHIAINGNVLEYKAVDGNGEVRDKFVISK